MRVIKGRVLSVDKETVWLAQGRHLLKSTDGGHCWTLRATLPCIYFRDELAGSRLGRRLGRSGFHHFLSTGSDAGLVIANRHIYRLAPAETGLKRISNIVGSRPLAFATGKGLACYGEYRGDPERSPVHVWGADIEKPSDWNPLWRFEKVRHVHGVFFDPYFSDFWVTTGDEDNETGIWRTTDNFKTLDLVAGGSQQKRAVQLLFTPEFVYFGTDTPREQNYICRLERKSGNVERLSRVDSSVFYGCKVDDQLFFSTVVEPSKINRSRYSAIWKSSNGEDWIKIKTFRKDLWPMKYFQYGQILFPSGPGDGQNLWFTPFATEYDQQTFILNLSYI